jgi:hypothetical protein
LCFRVSTSRDGGEEPEFNQREKDEFCEENDSLTTRMENEFCVLRITSYVKKGEWMWCFVRDWWW